MEVTTPMTTLPYAASAHVQKVDNQLDQKRSSKSMGSARGQQHLSVSVSVARHVSVCQCPSVRACVCPRCCVVVSVTSCFSDCGFFFAEQLQLVGVLFL